MRLIFALALASCAFALSFKEDPYWIAYKSTFGKSYTPREEARRYNNFLDNMAKAAKLNKIDAHARYGWTKFSDMKTEELLRPMTAPKNSRRVTLAHKGAVKLPDEFSWIDQGAVNAIKDQANCGSCWAFCAVASMEGAHFIKHGELLSLSEQQLVDCDENDSGCNGGWPTTGMEWIRDHGGINSEADYPYEAIDNSCRFDSSKVVMQVDGVYEFTAGDVENMMLALTEYGPLSVAVDATKFQSYNGGIMGPDGCSYGINHGVAVVGWGSEGGVDYWLVRNSWGESWGEAGYVRMQRGVNTCFIEDYPMGCTAL